MAELINDKEPTVKVIGMTDLRATRSEEIMKLIDEYDIVILKMKTGDLKLEKVRYS